MNRLPGPWTTVHHNLGFVVLALVCLAMGESAHAEILEGRVVSVHDGDTVTVLDRHKTQFHVRLAGIDAPELGQPFGRRSKEALAQRVFQQEVTVDWDKRDRYQRLVGKVWIHQADANLAQVQDGLAWHYKDYAKEQSAADRVEYAAAETQARQAGRGLWQQPDPVAPWVYRKQRKPAVAP